MALAPEVNLCNACGKAQGPTESFYRTITKPPFCDQVVLCRDCLKVIMKDPKWKEQKYTVEEVKLS